MQTNQAGTTVGDCLSKASNRLRDNGLDAARRDARALLAHVLETTVEGLFGHPEQAVAAPDAEIYFNLIARRSKHEPLSRLIGRREFWSLDFLLSPATLDPRPDSETIIEAVIEARPNTDQDLRILDLGTGSGCLIGALLSEFPKARGVAVDVSVQAVETASDNLHRLGFGDRVKCQRADWDAGLDGRFDVIVSNPPYIVDADIATMSEAVSKYDPRLALAGGYDGLEAYRQLAPVVFRRLADDGVAILEHGDGQHESVAEICRRGGLDVCGQRAGLAGRLRCIILSHA